MTTLTAVPPALNVRLQEGETTLLAQRIETEFDAPAVTAFVEAPAVAGTFIEVRITPRAPAADRYDEVSLDVQCLRRQAAGNTSLRTITHKGAHRAPFTITCDRYSLTVLPE